MRIDPWSSAQYEDYARLRDEFGIQPFDFEGLPNPCKLIRRGAIFGHRGFELIKDAIVNNKRFVILTGLMPSGNMHIGNKMVIDQVIYYQSVGAEIFVAVADIEAYATRNVTFEEARKIAIESYIVNYIALGLAPDNCEIYFQSKREAVKDLAYTLGKKVNWSEMKAIYGFEDSTNMAHVFAPLVQVGDILHVQLERYGGPRPTLVPVGVDQDPHMRLTRNLALASRFYSIKETPHGYLGVFVKGDDNVKELLDAAQIGLSENDFKDFEKNYAYKALYIKDAVQQDIPKIDAALILIELKFGGSGFYLPSSAYNVFMSGLTGGKMSSSIPESLIMLNDDPKVGAKKVMNAKTGGAVSQEEQRKHGGKPEECTVYELLLYHLIDDDEELNEIFETCKDGSRMCGECKKYTARLMEAFLADLEDKRKIAKRRIDEYVVWE
ncbi:MAG: tryptophan--tRNA ligase [Candidatus Altiarchaeales archaeon WOR_SM1_79]|nr:MAG: tryptophan--tRNA ligase [Candidatus Altiarchaeales archaeon WOR_SM1_79]